MTREQLAHVLRTMLQVVENAYYRSGFLTTEHTVFEVVKRALESGISAAEHTDTEALVSVASDDQNNR